MDAYISNLLKYHALVQSTLKLNIDLYEYFLNKVKPGDKNFSNLAILLNNTIVLSVENTTTISENLKIVYNYQEFCKSEETSRNKLIQLLDRSESDDNSRTYTFNVDEIDKYHKDYLKNFDEEGQEGQ
jgi:hypothetical protein